MPFYEEISHMPLFIWDPRTGRRGQRRTSLVQTIDLPATLLEYFGVERPSDMQGAALRATVDRDAPVRQAGLFGVHGAHVNCTDGRFVYMRAPVRPDNTPLYNHTLMPTHMRNPFSVKELQDLQLAEPFAFTKGCRTMKTPAGAWGDPHKFRTMLFDLAADPTQQNPIRDLTVEQRMIEHTVRLMKANDAPAEQYERLGLPTPS
jgi:hypothetical protein